MAEAWLWFSSRLVERVLVLSRDEVGEEESEMVELTRALMDTYLGDGFTGTVP